MRETFRTLRWSSWLGWQIESNWADWRLFLLYLVIKPVTGSLVLVCMFFAVQYSVGGLLRSGLLPYIYVSNACYGLVNTVMFGMSYVVITDREHYRMLKYIFISPATFSAYFVGRGLARGLEGAIGGAITIIVGSTVASDMLQSWQMKRHGEVTDFRVHRLLATLLGKLPMIASVFGSIQHTSPETVES